MRTMFYKINTNQKIYNKQNFMVVETDNKEDVENANKLGFYSKAEIVIKLIQEGLQEDVEIMVTETKKEIKKASEKPTKKNAKKSKKRKIKVSQLVVDKDINIKETIIQE